MAANGLLQTPLHAWHAAHGGRMVEFGGWSMPVQYTTITEEHQAVRTRVGLFDISHMGRLGFDGADAESWLEFATTNHVARLQPGQIQYSLMVDEHGGVLDDILVYRMSNGSLRVVCNASNRSKVVEQLRRLGGGKDATVHDVTEVTAMIAVQGPRALATVAPICDVDLPALGYYRVTEGKITAGAAAKADVVVSRTGYTGEDGFELIVAAPLAVAVWETLLESGRTDKIQACGLGARDTLRFEAAMPLYGHEMHESVNPYAAGLGWAVKLNKGEFIGRDALRQFKNAPGRTRIGLELDGKRIARQGCSVVHQGRIVGAVTSGTFAPTLEKSLAMALVEPAVGGAGETLEIDVRGKLESARVAPLPFYKRT